MARSQWARRRSQPSGRTVYTAYIGLPLRVERARGGGWLWGDRVLFLGRTRTLAEAKREAEVFGYAYAYNGEKDRAWSSEDDRRIAGLRLRTRQDELDAAERIEYAMLRLREREEATRRRRALGSPDH